MLAEQRILRVWAEQHNLNMVRAEIGRVHQQLCAEFDLPANAVDIRTRTSCLADTLYFWGAKSKNFPNFIPLVSRAISVVFREKCRHFSNAEKNGMPVKTVAGTPIVYQTRGCY